MKRYFSLILAIAATVSAQIVPSTGNVRGPTSATDNAVARYDGTTGKLIQNSGVTIDDSGNLTVSGGGATFGASGGGDAVLSLKRASDGITVGNLTVNTSSSLLNLGTAYTFLTFSTEGTEKARFSASTGNLLLKSDGIDSSNGKLQLATHSSYTGGIGFGTTTSLYNDGTGILGLTRSDGGGTGGINIYSSSTLKARLTFSGSDAYLDAPTGQLIVRTNGYGTAMTLSSTQALRLNAYGAGALTTDSSGNVTATSDERAKNIIGTFTKGLAEVVKLTPKTYTWKPETGLNPTDEVVSLTAQDLIAAGLPEAVSTYRTVADLNDDGTPKLDADGKPLTKRIDATYTVSDRAVIAALVNAIKELNAKVAALEAARK